MIEAEIKHKIPELARQEDTLTSTVFGLLKYLPMRDALIAFLGRAHLPHNPGARFDGELRRNPLVPGPLSIDFWKRFGEFGIPDLVLTTPNSAIAIEVKFDAPMSGEDQLSRYRDMLSSFFPKKKHRHVIYLTKDLAVPELEAFTDSCGAQNLWWLSWYELPQVLEREAKRGGIVQEMCEDLLRYLDARALCLFQGFHISNVKPMGQAFWNDAKPLIGIYDRPKRVKRFFWEAIT